MRDEAKPGLLSRAFERRLRSDGARLSRHARCVAARALADAAGDARHHRGDGRGPSAWSRRASCRPRTPASSSCARRRRPTSPSRPCSTASASSRSASAPIPTCSTSTPTSPQTLLQSHAQPRLDLRAAQGARPSAQDKGTHQRRAEPPAPQPGRHPRHPRLPRAAAESAHRQPRRRGALPIHADQRQPGRALRQRAAADRAREDRRRASPTSRAT